MQCPECQSSHIRKNGMRRGKQNHICVDCGRQFVENPQMERGYSDDVRRICLSMALNSSGFRAIERVTGVHHTTVINWVKQVAERLPDSYTSEEIPEVGELDERQTFVGSKKNKIWIWTVVNHFKPSLLEWVVGDHSAKTFEPLWAVVSLWNYFFYITDGLKVYPYYILDGDQIVCKTYMTRVEGENTRLRPYLARLHRKTLCYSKSLERLKNSIRLLIHYLKFWDVPVPPRQDPAYL